MIENDIAWRIQTMVDFLFGKPVRLSASGASGERGALIERVLDAVWEASGGVAMLQDAALLGHVYGHVDFLVRVDAEGMERALRSLPEAATEEERALCGAGFVRIEVVEAKRGIAELSQTDYRRITRYVVHAGIRGGVREEGALAAVRRALGLAAECAEGEVVEVVTAERTRTFVDGALVREDETPWAGNEPPVVHVQNLAQPYCYEGLSDVEALIPLQDELNTRLSDRACRVTLQSFKMYLAKGVEGVEKAGVGPGLIVSTNNPDAAIEAFGGDASSPSEERHVQEVREALDKLSGVPPLAAGVVRAKLGNLSSASALRVTLMGLLARTERKRTLYGKGLSRVSGLVLAALDHAGALPTSSGERAVRCIWQDRCRAPAGSGGGGGGQGAAGGAACAGCGRNWGMSGARTRGWSRRSGKVARTRGCE